MITDEEIKIKGIHFLALNLGDVEAERFIALIQRVKFDYTKWRQSLENNLTLEELSKKAMEYNKINETNSKEKKIKKAFALRGKRVKQSAQKSKKK